MGKPVSSVINGMPEVATLPHWVQEYGSFRSPNDWKIRTLLLSDHSETILSKLDNEEKQDGHHVAIISRNIT